MYLSDLSVKRPVFIVMIVLSIITLGIIGYNRLSVDLMPDVEFPTISVITVYPGASAEEVESLITEKLEDSFSTLEGIDKISSSSKEGVSVVIATFKLGVDVKYAEIKVREKLQAVRPFLPKDIEEPIMQRFSLSDIPVMWVGALGTREMSISDLKEFIENTIKPELEQVEGVANVEIYGGRDKVVKIVIDKSLLVAKGISLQQVLTAIKKENLNYPAGTIKMKKKNISVRVIGKFKTIEDIKNIPIKTFSGNIVKLKNIAKVKFTLEDEKMRTRINKNQGIVFAIYKQSGTNSIKVAHNVEEKIKEINKNISNGIKILIVHDTTPFIKRSIKSVQEDLLLGAFLAVLVVWIFLGNFRSTIITAIALPDSVLGAFFLINLYGFSLNIMTLMALSLAIGLLIDDSIVVRENIFRYIENGMDPKEAAKKGTDEVSMAVIATTFSIMAVFIPISFLEGVIGQFFKEFGFTVAFALLISLLDAFTTAPMLSAYWYKKEKIHKKGIQKLFQELSKKWNVFYNALNEIYRKILNWSLDNKKKVLISTIILFLFSIFSLKYVGMSFIPKEDRGFFTISLESYPGTPLNIIDKYVNEIENYLLKESGVRTFYTITGDSGSNTAKIFVELKDIKHRKILTEKYMDIIRKYIIKNFGTAVNVKVLNEGMVSGGEDIRTPISISLKGDDLKVLENIAKKIKKIVEETPGATDVDMNYRPGSPEIVIRPDRLKLTKLGLSTFDIGMLLRTLINGSKISTYRPKKNDYDIILQLDKDSLKDIQDLKNIILTVSNGQKVPLSAICNFEYSSGPVEIKREDKQRIIKITGDVLTGYSLSDVLKRIKKQIKEKVEMPAGYKYSFGGQAKEMKSLMRQMIFAMLLAVLFMYMILASLYNSFIQPIILMVSVPLALIGAFLALLITGKDLDMMGFIGLMMVLGLVAKNAILLIDFTNKKREEGFSIRDALLYAGPIRLRPILMTTFAMIFGMLPLALGIGEGAKGKEAMPISVIGGLLTSTFLTLVVVPVIYEWVENKMVKKQIKNKRKK